MAAAISNPITCTPVIASEPFPVFDSFECIGGSADSMTVLGGVDADVVVAPAEGDVGGVSGGGGVGAGVDAGPGLWVLATMTPGTGFGLSDTV